MSFYARKSVLLYLKVVSSFKIRYPQNNNIGVILYITKVSTGYNILITIDSGQSSVRWFITASSLFIRKGKNILLAHSSKMSGIMTFSSWWDVES